jgi:hypothetical protein
MSVAFTTTETDSGSGYEFTVRVTLEDPGSNIRQKIAAQTEFMNFLYDILDASENG